MGLKKHDQNATETKYELVKLVATFHFLQILHL